MITIVIDCMYEVFV